MISKKLLSIITNTTVTAITGIGQPTIQYEIAAKTVVGDGVVYRERNIYELANLCKKWAYTAHKVCLMSTLYARDTWVCSAQGDDPFMEANTEYEAIFMAAQWILENKER